MNQIVVFLVLLCIFPLQYFCSLYLAPEDVHAEVRALTKGHRLLVPLVEGGRQIRAYGTSFMKEVLFWGNSFLEIVAAEWQAFLEDLARKDSDDYYDDDEHDDPYMDGYGPYGEGEDMEPRSYYDEPAAPKHHHSHPSSSSQGGRGSPQQHQQSPQQEEKEEVVRAYFGRGDEPRQTRTRVRYHIGQVVHYWGSKKTGIIIGWDLPGKAPSSWFEENKIQEQHRVDPFYVVLKEGTGFVDIDEVEYVWQGDLVEVKGDADYHPNFVHSNLAHYFEAYNQHTKLYIPKPYLKKKYPKD